MRGQEALVFRYLQCVEEMERFVLLSFYSLLMDAYLKEISPEGTCIVRKRK